MTEKREPGTLPGSSFALLRLAAVELGSKGETPFVPGMLAAGAGLTLPGVITLAVAMWISSLMQPGAPLYSGREAMIVFGIYPPFPLAFLVFGIVFTSVGAGTASAWFAVRAARLERPEGERSIPADLGRALAAHGRRLLVQFGPVWLSIVIIFASLLGGSHQDPLVRNLSQLVTMAFMWVSPVLVLLWLLWTYPRLLHLERSAALYGLGPREAAEASRECSSKLRERGRGVPLIVFVMSTLVGAFSLVLVPIFPFVLAAGGAWLGLYMHLAIDGQ